MIFFYVSVRAEYSIGPGLVQKVLGREINMRGLLTTLGGVVGHGRRVDGEHVAHLHAHVRSIVRLPRGVLQHAIVDLRVEVVVVVLELPRARYHDRNLAKEQTLSMFSNKLNYATL